MKREIDDILKQALSPDLSPDPRLNLRIIHQREENFDMKETMCQKPRLRARAAVAAAICCVLAVGSVTTYAAWKLLSAGDVVTEYGDLKLAEAFTGEDAVLVNESQTCGNYRITLLGAVSGENISDFLEHGSSRTFYMSSGGQYLSLEDNRLYTVIAIEHADGTPMPATSDDAYGDEAFFVSPYIKGLNPRDYNSFTLKGSYTELVIDGVQYRILETTNVELFADRGVYIGVNDGVFYANDAFLYDETTGEITRNAGYTGLNALFTLPLNPAHGDPDAAQAWLDAINQATQGEPEMNYSATASVTANGVDGQPTQETVAVYGIDTAAFQSWRGQLVSDDNLVDQEALKELCAVIPQTVQTCQVSGSQFTYAWDLDGRGGASGTVKTELVFPEGSTPGTMVCLGYSFSLSDGDEDSLRAAQLETALLNEDGSVTVAVYVPKEYLGDYTD